MGDHRLEEWRSFLSLNIIIFDVLVLKMFLYSSSIYSTFQYISVWSSLHSSLLLSVNLWCNTMCLNFSRTQTRLMVGPCLGLGEAETDHRPHLEIPHTIPHFKHETLTQDRTVKTQECVCQVLSIEIARKPTLKCVILIHFRARHFRQLLNLLLSCYWKWVKWCSWCQVLDSEMCKCACNGHFPHIQN